MLRKVGARQECRAAGQRDGHGCPDVTAGLVYTSTCRPEGQAAAGRLADGSRIAESNTGRRPTPKRCSRRLVWWSNKGNVGALQEITDETYQAAGRQDQFVDLVPRLAELTAGLNRQVNDIITAVDGLNRSLRSGERQGQPGPRTRHAAGAIRVLNKNSGPHRRRVRRTQEAGTVTSRVLSKPSWTSLRISKASIQS